jgi:NAD(P)-dependent dehydrogenase (short-subunit alcohol dehydrogenase family)
VNEVLSQFSLSGRVAIVSGASSGLGECVARALAAAGARVALVARRVDRLAQLAAEIDGLAISCDLLDPAALDEVVPEVVRELGNPQILVNAAGGVSSRDKGEDESLEAIHQTIDLNLVAPFRLSQAVFPQMIDVGQGSIVFVSSLSGHVGVPSIPQASYAAAKLGLTGLTRELATQWARHSIRVNTIAPGFFRSEMTESLYASERGAAWLERNSLLPYQGTPEDFAGTALWLASDASRYVTGQTILVDGGWTTK